MVIIGHSWAKRFEQSLDNGVIQRGNRFVPREHECYFFYHAAPGERLYTVDQLERNQEDLGGNIKAMFGAVDV